MIFKKLICRLSRFLMVRFPIKGRYRLMQFVINRGLHKDVELNVRLDRNVRMRLRPDEHVQQNIFFHNYYERNETRYWKKMAANCKTVLDIGGNVGYYSLLASPLVGNDGRVFMFEPVSINLERAKKNIGLSGFTNVDCIKKAVSNQPGAIRIRIAENDNLGMSGMAESINNDGQDEEVEGITLDQFAKDNQLDCVDLIKVDVEGAEPLVLQGGRELLSRCSPVIMMEVCIDTLVRLSFGLEDVYKPLAEMGYKPYLINDDLSLNFIEKPISKEGLIVFKKD